MSQDKKDPKQPGPIGGVFSGGSDKLRDAIPTEAEGDALLDMLFDDAPRSAPAPAAPPAEPAPAEVVPPPGWASTSPRPGAAIPRPGATPAPAPFRDAPTPPAPPEEVEAAARLSMPDPSPLPSLESDDGYTEVPTRIAQIDPAMLLSEIAAAENAAAAAAPAPPATPPAPPAAPDDDDDDDYGGATMLVRSTDDLIAGGEPPAPAEPPAAFPESAAEIEHAEAAEEHFAREEPAQAFQVDEGDQDVSVLAGDYGAEEPAAEASAPPRPVSVPPRTTGGALEDERDASLVLQASGQLDAFLGRAAWMREEANAIEDKAAKARMLVVVSELYALGGADEDAAATAAEAHRLAPNQALGLRQHRSLLARAGDWGGALDVMDVEARSAPTAEGRAHASWFAAEIARIAQRDEALAKKRGEQTLRSVSTDPRPVVQRFVDAAAQGQDPAHLARIKPSDEAHASLAAAFADVVGGRAAERAVASPAHPATALATARAALSKGDAAALGAALEQFDAGTLRHAAAWVRASLALPRAATRPAALAALRVAAGGEGAPHAARALAAASVELGEAVDASDAEAFSPLDRVALLGLGAARATPDGRASRGVLPTLLDEASSQGDLELVQLAMAVNAGVAESGTERLSRLRYSGANTPAGRASIVLGRVLGNVRDAAASHRDLIESALGGVAGESDLSAERLALLRALSLELDIDAAAADRVAQTIATWGRDGQGADDVAGLLAAALLAELSGDRSRARQAYLEAHEREPAQESALRAVEQLGGAEPDLELSAKLVREHAEALPHGTPKAVLLTEAAIRLVQRAEGGPTDEAEAAARAAAEIAPQLPIALHIGEIAARARGDQDGLVEWLRFRREVSDDPVERAHDLTREALLAADGAAPLLEQALAARPGDYGLRDLFERLSPEPPADRAAWREARLADAGREAPRLAVEAALEYERNGDLEAAARCARLAEAAGERDLAPIALNRFAQSGAGTAELVDALLPAARETNDPALRLESYERLAELDERGRGDTASGLLFRRTILEENPAHVRTLRLVASALMAGGRDDELEPIALELARNLEGPESIGYAALNWRLRLRSKWEDTFEAIQIAATREPKTAWVLRQLHAHAQARGDHATAASAARELTAFTDRPLEQATLALRAAEELRAAGDAEGAKAALVQASQLAPEHVMVRLALADALEASGDARAAASQLETAAENVATPAWRFEIASRAARMWMDVVGDTDRARDVLEAIVAADPNDLDAFERLRKIYVAAGARSELAGLLGRRLDAIQDPAERVEMEVMRGRALAEVGDADAAKRALAAALDQSPDHPEALTAFADLCFADGDYEGAEQSLIRLARLSNDPDRQIDIYFRLGELYDERLPNDDRAEAAYQEILKRRPTELAARERLVALFRRTGQFPRAVEEQNELVNVAEDPDTKCARTVELAEILEEMGELKKAESTLVVARKSFPKSDLAVRALVKFYQRTGQGPAAAVLLDRAVADARRALGTGRFEPFLFETLATAADLRGRADAAVAARATVRALEGDEVDVGGAGPRAGDASLDELLAPEVMTPAFREILLRTGAMLDTAFPYDLDGIRALPLPPPLAPLGEEVRALAGAYGLPQIQVLVSNVLGAVVVPARSHPPTLVVGQTLAAQPASAERSFLLHRAMKVLQSNTCVLARTAPIDLWPVLAGYLKVFSPQFVPQGVDAARFSEAFGKLSRALPPGLPQDVQLLAADVIGNIGNRASTLNAAINGWGSRAGLLAVGDPNVALTGIAWAGGNVNGPPTSGKDRVTWIGRNAEARDLIVFSVSDPYVDARARLGAG